MQDPVQEFADRVRLLTDPAERESQKRAFVGQVEQAFPAGLEQLRVIDDASNRLGEDLTRFMAAFQAPRINAVSKTELDARVDEALSNAPWYRRALGGAIDAAEWWISNVSEPAAATALATIFKAIPGEQTFDRRLEQTRRERAGELGLEYKAGSLTAYIQNATEAYRNTDLGWGMKGFSELLFDPLNLIGLGLPARLAAASPAVIRAALIPFRVLDAAPGVVAQRLILAPGRGVLRGIPGLDEVVIPGLTRGVLDVPGIRSLAKPHIQTQVNEARRRGFAAVSEAFGPARFTSGLPQDTTEVFSNLYRFPEDATTSSLRNVVNHIAEEFGDKPAGIRKWEKFHDELVELTPEQAAVRVSDEFGRIERNALTAKRAEGKKAMMDKLAIDHKIANAIIAPLDGLFSKFWDVYTRKIEPNITRPWAIAHLAFAGFLPMNMIEDIGISAVGLSVNPFGMTDEIFRAVTAGVDGTPLHLFGVQDQVKSMMDLNLGIYREADKTATEKVGRAIARWGGVELSGKMGFAIRRTAWARLYMKEYEKAIRKAGATSDQIDLFRRFMDTELPARLNHLATEINAKVWASASTGRPEDIKNLKSLFTSKTMTQQHQRSLMKEFPELPPDARRAYYRAIENGLTEPAMAQLQADMREHILDWHKFSGTGIRAQFTDFLNAIGTRPARSPAEAAAQLRMLQGAGDALAALPREIQARAREQVRRLPPQSREKVWADAAKTIDEDLGDIRAMYEEALERVKPVTINLLSSSEVVKTAVQGEAVRRSIDDIFDAYQSVSRNLDETWKTARARRQELLDATPRDGRDDAFWRNFDEVGDDIWNSERRFRAEQADRARTGWNAVAEILPSDLSGKNRAFLKSGVESALADADTRINELRVELARLESSIVKTPPNLTAAVEQEMAKVKQLIVSADAHSKSLTRQLESIGVTRGPRKPEVLLEYDKATQFMRKQLEKARPGEIPRLQQRLAELEVERQQVLVDFIPDRMKPEYQRLLQEQQIIRQASDAAIGTPTERRVKQDLRRADARVRKFEKDIESGSAQSRIEDIGMVSIEMASKAARSILNASGGKPPRTIEEVIEFLDVLSTSGDEAADAIVIALGNQVESADEVIERIFSQTHLLANTNPLTALQFQALQDVVTRGDVFPTKTMVELVEGGFLEQPTILAGGRWRVVPSENGRVVLNAPPNDMDISSIVDNLPPAQIEFESSLENQLSMADDLLTKAQGIADNPPLPRNDESLIQSYLDRVANQLDTMSDLRGAMQEARQSAAIATNAQYNQLFIDYDNRSTFDYIMQRFMPFWMYESRRWPRLITLAGKRPMLAKYGTLVGGDWDYGYQPVPSVPGLGGGFEFHPAKGTLFGGLRPALARDFPELHSGFRGGLEQGLDWLGRGGFYFSPPITTAFNVMQQGLGKGFGESLPPGLSAGLHGLSAVGIDIPVPFDALLNTRYVNFVTDQVLAEDFQENPQDLRRRASLGNDVDAIAIYDLARQRASAKYIGVIQSGVVRYRPEGKREFRSDSEDAVEEILGVPKDVQRDLRLLGIPIQSVIPISRFQRAELRESIANYDAWVGASVSLRPQEEQRRLEVIDEFWFEMERIQIEFETDSELLSSRWQEAQISGPQARRDYSELQRQRAAQIDSLKSQQRFAGGNVPLTPREREEWATRHGSPPPLIHPVDEALERYYQVKPEDFTNPLSGEPNWTRYFAAREQILTEYPAEVENTARQALIKHTTPLERNLEAASPFLEAYYGVRGEILEVIRQEDPAAADAYIVYQQLANRARLTLNPRESLYWERQAKLLLAHNPQLSIAESLIRNMRKRMRQSPRMERVYQTFIAQPERVR